MFAVDVVDPRSEGRAARRAGAGAETCPHEVGSPLWEAWMLGFMGPHRDQWDRHLRPLRFPAKLIPGWIGAAEAEYHGRRTASG